MEIELKQAPLAHKRHFPPGGKFTPNLFQRRFGTKAISCEHRKRLTNVLLEDEQVKVGKLAQRQISIDARGECWSFERECAHPVLLQQAAQPQHLSSQIAIAHCVTMNLEAHTIMNRCG